MSNLMLDVRHALRGFRRAPAFVLVAVSSLAFAIAANAFAFGLLNAVVLRPLDVVAPDELYQLRLGPAKSGGLVTTSYPAFLDLRERTRTLSDLVGIYAYSAADLRWRDVSVSMRGLEVTTNYFDALGVRPQRGRLFHADDDRGFGTAPYVVLSDASWRRTFGADPGIVGAPVTLEDEPFVVIGVAPPGFHGTERLSWPDYWIPIVNKIGGTEVLRNRGRRAVTVVGRVRPEVTREQATADLQAVTAQLARENPKTDAPAEVRLIRPGLFGDDGEGIRRFLMTVNVLALLLLVAVCVNLASAFAARAADRSRETALRVALGSGPWRLARQILTEALVLALAGGAVGLLATGVLLSAVNRWEPSFGYGAQRLALPIEPAPHVYLAGLALTVLSALAFGMAPVRRAWVLGPLPTIKGDVADASRRRVSLRDVLLGAQIAICTLLVTASIVAVRGLTRALGGSAAGIAPQGVMLVSLDLAQVGVPGDAVLQRQKELIASAGTLPGTIAVGAVRETPLGSARRVSPVFHPGTPELTPAHQVLATHVYPMSPGYLRAAGTRLLAGRDVSWLDTASSPRVALVNATFARAMWGDRPPLGRRFVLAETTVEVVGVVEDGKYHSLMESPAPAAFVPLPQHPTTQLVILLRSRLTPEEIATSLPGTLARIQPGLQVAVRPWPEALATALFPSRATAAALGLMGLAAVMLAVTGIFGMAAHIVSRRSRELGIRVALGAGSAQVLRAAVARPAALLGAGCSCGMLVSLLASRLLDRLVYRADAADPLLLAATVLTMAAVGVLGSALPAWRAVAVDPTRLLREE